MDCSIDFANWDATSNGPRLKTNHFTFQFTGEFIEMNLPSNIFQGTVEEQKQIRNCATELNVIGRNCLRSAQMNNICIQLGNFPMKLGPNEITVRKFTEKSKSFCATFILQC